MLSTKDDDSPALKGAASYAGCRLHGGDQLMPSRSSIAASAK